MSPLVACISLLLFSSPSAQGAAPPSNHTDRASLLEFKSRVTDDPDGVLSSWNDTVSFCLWPGVTCSLRHHSRVIRLELPRSRFGGSLSPYVGNLSFLRVLDMDANSFTGGIPPEIGKLRRLFYLGLQNNSFSGQIPENITGCVKLRVIRLRNSMLVGELPSGLAALSELRFFSVRGNHLTGKFPEFFGNLSFLEQISGTDNNFSGSVPDSLGKLLNLKVLGMGGNSISGIFPSSILNITSLEGIFFLGNQLEGGLHSDLGYALPNLVEFSFGENKLTGPLPLWVSNATKLQIFEVPLNSLSGSVPSLENLNRLQWLLIDGNNLGTGAQGDLRFVDSLNSTDLQVLDSTYNNFGGTLPPTIGNLSNQLTWLGFGVNELTGTIPPSIWDLRKLETLVIASNRFTGSIPEEVGRLNKLKVFLGHENRFSGEIPSSIGNLTLLTKLALGGNELRGRIPESLGECQNLFILSLSENKLNGEVPSRVLSISSLALILDLSQNELTGAIPDEIGNLINLRSLNVQGNRLSGRVPDSIGWCTSLEVLNMGNNLFQGNISSFLSPLKGLQYLDLSQNDFSGEIPKFLGSFHLLYLNLSSNRFEGEVPNQGVFLNVTAFSIKGNDKLCGGIPELNLPSCPTSEMKRMRKLSRKVIILSACASTLLFIVLLLLALYICTKRKRRNVKPHSEMIPVGSFPLISYEDILRATGGLSQDNLMGAGSFGSVYKGILQTSDNHVAIKVLDLKNRSASKSFVAECEALRYIRHRNLVKIHSACSSIDFKGNDFKALVSEYMENGSLEGWLHPEVEAEAEVHGKLSLSSRLSIAVDVACAVGYLHHEIETPIIHCDLKPSNILLDAEMTAHVGDFGLARILSAADVILQVSSVGVKGTVGYSPPEYGLGSKESREGDVYSYGILLLEMFTGKRPTDDMFEEGWNIRSYCEAALPDRAVEMADPYLFVNEFGEGSSVRAPRRMKECLAKVLEIGIACCRELPGDRMDIREASAKLRSIKALVR